MSSLSFHAAQRAIHTFKKMAPSVLIKYTTGDRKTASNSALHTLLKKQSFSFFYNGVCTLKTTAILLNTLAVKARKHKMNPVLHQTPSPASV